MADITTATGKRKSSIARVRLMPGTGQITVNGRRMDEYFPRPALQILVRKPMELTGGLESWDVVANIHGGGVAGQAGALRHGIAKAIEKADGGQRLTLKRARAPF